MVIGIIGESCTGKSTIADELSKLMNVKIYTGKDYMRLAKNEAEAKKQFAEMLQSSATSTEVIVYVISEKDHMALLPSSAIKVLVTADIETIKERFAKRMNGNMPAPVAAMLEKKHGIFDNEQCDLRVENVGDSVSDICSAIVGLCS